MMDQTVLLHNMILHTRVLGPEVRTAIWFQGCRRRCKGCMSPSSRDLNGGVRVPVAQVCEKILQLTDIEGITISGGEPFLQPKALHSLLSEIRSRSSLGIIIYTGYRLSELAAMNDPLIDRIITSLSDLIIDGEYIDELNDGKNLKGSSNQTLHHITGRYLPYSALYERTKRDVEVRMWKNEGFLIGVPDKQTLKDWLKTTENL